MCKTKIDILQLFHKYSPYSVKNGGTKSGNSSIESSERYYSPGPSFQNIFDHTIQDFVYLSPNLNNLIGISKEGFSMREFIDRIGEQDLKHFFLCQEIASNFYFNEIEKKDILSYKLSFQYKFKFHNKYKLVLHQAICLNQSKEGRMIQVLANVSDISHFTTKRSSNIVFTNLNTDELIVKNAEDPTANEEDNSIFTKRENEIIRLIAEDHSSEEIADLLFISKNTVRTHRQNILKKSNEKTYTALISNMIKSGLL